MFKTYTTSAFGLLALFGAAFAAPSISSAQQGDANAERLMTAALDCYKEHAPAVIKSESKSGIGASVSALQNYICLQETQHASAYIRNADLVARYGEKLTARFNRTIGVNEDTGALVTDMQYNDVSVTGWQDLMNAISIHTSDPFSAYNAPLPALTQKAGRIVLEATTSGE